MKKTKRIGKKEAVGIQLQRLLESEGTNEDLMAFCMVLNRATRPAEGLSYSQIAEAFLEATGESIDWDVVKEKQVDFDYFKS